MIDLRALENLEQPNREFGVEVNDWTRGGYGNYIAVDVPEFTRSLDAIVALIDRVRPGWDYALDSAEGCAVLFEHGWRNTGHRFEGHSLYMPIALSAALLRSIQG